MRTEGAGAEPTVIPEKPAGGGRRAEIPEMVPEMGPSLWALLKILLPSAVHLEERLTVSHSVPAPGQQAVRQKHTVWFFCQWQMRP